MRKLVQIRKRLAWWNIKHAFVMVWTFRYRFARPWFGSLGAIAVAWAVFCVHPVDWDEENLT